MIAVSEADVDEIAHRIERKGVPLVAAAFKIDGPIVVVPSRTRDRTGDLSWTSEFFGA